ncbi:unnamed protein product, partial [Didymodactylos carnosus]
TNNPASNDIGKNNVKTHLSDERAPQYFYRCGNDSVAHARYFQDPEHFRVICEMLMRVQYRECDREERGLKGYLSYVFYTSSPYLIVWASFDRYCSTSQHIRLRKFSDLYVVRRVIPLTFVFFLIMYIPILIFYDIGPLNNVCGVQNALFYQIFTCYILVLYGIGPPLLMAIFGLLTIWNIRQNRQRVMPIANVLSSTKRRTDGQLFQMLMLQILSYIVLVIMSMIMWFLSTIIQSPSPVFIFVFKITSIPLCMNKQASADNGERETVDDSPELEGNDVVDEAMQVYNNNDYSIVERNDDDSVQENGVDGQAGALESNSDSDSEIGVEDTEDPRSKFNFSTHSCLQSTDLENHVLHQKIVSLASVEQNKPLSVLKDLTIEALAFSHIFPDGKDTFNNPRVKSLSFSLYCNKRLFSADPRFAEDAVYVFFLEYLNELKKAHSSVSVALRKQFPTKIV